LSSAEPAARPIPRRCGVALDGTRLRFDPCVVARRPSDRSWPAVRVARFGLLSVLPAAARGSLPAAATTRAVQ